MIEIVPAVLPSSYKDLEEHLSRVHRLVRAVQIDVVDGHFAHNKTWPYRDKHTFEKIVADGHGLPHWEEFDFEFDLMVANSAEVVMQYVHAGASRIIIHADAPGADRGLEILADVRDDDNGPFVVKTGLALLPTMQPEILERFDALFDFVQVMGIERVGFQGEPFSHQAITLVERLRHRYPTLPIQVDGGVTMSTAHALVKAGATRLVAGSAIFRAENTEEALQALRAEANKS